MPKPPPELPPAPLEPPASEVIQRGQWQAVPDDDPLVRYLATRVWNRDVPPRRWEVARLSAAAHIFREAETGWAVVAKFYAAKTGKDAHRHAERERRVTEKALSSGLASGPIRAQRVLGLWRGVLLLEYVDGLTLEDLIAVRRHRPGELLPALENAAQLLATLHTHSPQHDTPATFASDAAYAHKLVVQLSRWGVLQDNPIVCGSLDDLIDRWAGEPAMPTYTPTLIHGDATTTNFVYPWGGGVVGIDWERLKIADPAADLGRLIAEVNHSITRHGGTPDEAESLIEHLFAAYVRARDGESGEALAHRVRFHRASSTLRIARNGWLPRLERLRLVTEALALLAQCP